MQFQYSWIRSFHFTAQCGSIASAGEYLSLSSSTLSHQIKDLEKFFKVKLFYRHGNKIYLTNIGLSLKKITDNYFKTEQNIKSFLAKVRNRVNKVINIGAENPMKVVPLLDQVRKKNENIKLNMFFEKNDLLIEMFIKNKVDLLMINKQYFEEHFNSPSTPLSSFSAQIQQSHFADLSSTSQPLEGHGYDAISSNNNNKTKPSSIHSSNILPLIDAIPFYNDRLVFAIHEKHPLYIEYQKYVKNKPKRDSSNKSEPYHHSMQSDYPISWKKILETRIILPHKSSASRIYFEKLCHKFKFFPHETIEISSREGVITAVKNNLGIGIVLESEIIGRTNIHALQIPNPKDPSNSANSSKGLISESDLTIEEYVYFNRNIADLAVLKKFIKVIKIYSIEDFKNHPEL